MWITSIRDFVRYNTCTTKILPTRNDEQLELDIRLTLEHGTEYNQLTECVTLTFSNGIETLMDDTTIYIPDFWRFTQIYKLLIQQNSFVNRWTNKIIKLFIVIVYRANKTTEIN